MGDSEPPEEKVEDFYFKQIKKVRVFGSPDNLPTERVNLLAVSNKFGYTFVGCPKGFHIFKTSDFSKIDKDNDTKSPNYIVTEFPSTYVDIGQAVRHLGISSDNMTLSICYEYSNSVVMRVYDIPTLCGGYQAALGETMLVTGADLIDLRWNPGFPGIFVTCLSTGVVSVWEMSATQITQTASLTAAARATAICWSPKGKQLVVGHKNGKLTQFTPALQPKKETDCPDVFENEPHQVTSIYWISAPVFATVYTSADEGDSPKFVVIHNQTKTEPKKIVNFDDVYFGMSEERAQCFFTKYILEWNFAISSSCNAFEIAPFSNKNGWVKWVIDDNRAEMPLTDDNEETYPMGMAIDLTSTEAIIEHENALPPAPLLLLLSTDGVLCPFYLVNKKPDAKHDIVKPPEPLPPAGQRPKLTSSQPLPVQPPPPATVSIASSPFTFSTNPAMSTQPKPAEAGTPMLSMLLGAQSQNQQNQMPVFGGGFQLPQSAAKTKPTPAPSLFSAPVQAPFTLSGTKTSSAPAVAPSLFGGTQQMQPATRVTNAPTAALPPFGGATLMQPAAKIGGAPMAAPPPFGGAPLTQPTTKISAAPAAAFPPFGSAPLTQLATKIVSAPSGAMPPFGAATQSPLNLPATGGVLPPFGSATQSPLNLPATKTVSAPGGVLPPFGAATQSPLNQPATKTVSASGATPVLFGSATQSPLNPPATRLGGAPAPSLFKPTPTAQGQPPTTAQPRTKPLFTAPVSVEQIPPKPPLQKGLNQVKLATSAVSSPAPPFTTEQPRPPPPVYSERQTPTSSHADLELSVSKTIMEEIVHFNKELAQLNKNLHELNKTSHVSVQPETLRDLRKCADEVENLFKGLRETTKEHSKEIQDSKTTLLGSFEAVDEACIKKDKALDPRYLHLLKSRNLDPINAEKMKTIRNLYLYLDKTLSEVNLRMDEVWYEERQNLKKLQRPAMDTIYRTLKTHHIVAQEQASRLERLAELLKARRILPSSWHRPVRSLASSRNSSWSSLASAAFSQDLDASIKSPPKVPGRVPMKNIVSLRNTLKKRQTIPVRRQTGGVMSSPHVEKQKRREFMSPEATGTTVSDAKTPEDHVTSSQAVGVNPPKFPLGQFETPLTRVGKMGQPISSSTPFLPNQTVQSGFQAGAAGLTCKTGIVPPQAGFLPGKTGITGIQIPGNNAIPPAKGMGISPATNGGAVQGAGPGGFHGGSKAPAGLSALREEADTFQKPMGLGQTREDRIETVASSVPGSTFGFAMGKDRHAGPFPVPASKPPPDMDPRASVRLPPQPQPQPQPGDIPAGKAAALAAMNRASVSQSPPKPPSNLDPGASVEPVTMVTHKAAASGQLARGDANDSDTKALAIANEALKAAQAEAKKPISNPPPQSSTEFTFKTSGDTPKPGPPVVTFKPATAQDKGPAPNVTVKPVALQPSSVNRLPFAAPVNTSAAAKPKEEAAVRPPGAPFAISNSGLQLGGPSASSQVAGKPPFTFSLPSNSSGAFGSPSGGTASSLFTLPPKDASVPSVSEDDPPLGQGMLGYGLPSRHEPFSLSSNPTSGGFGSALPAKDANAASVSEGFSFVSNRDPVESDEARDDIKPSAGISRRLFEGVTQEEPSSTTGQDENKQPATSGFFSLSSTSTDGGSSLFGNPQAPVTSAATTAQDTSTSISGFSFAAPTSGFSFAGSSSDTAPTPAAAGFSFAGSSSDAAPTPAASGFSFAGASSDTAPTPASSDTAPTPAAAGFSFTVPSSTESAADPKPSDTTTATPKPDSTTPTVPAPSAASSTAEPTSTALFGTAGSTVPPASTVSTTNQTTGLSGGPGQGLFGSTSTTGLFEATSSSGAAPDSTTAPTNLSVKPAATVVPSVTASSATVAGASSSGQPATTASTTTQADTTGGITTNLFGQAAAITTPKVSAATTESATAGGLFGAATSSTTTASPFATSTGFGGQTGGGMFGATSTEAPSSTGSVFGNSSVSQPSSGGLFGATPQSSSGALFGSTAASSQPTSGGLFGTPASTTATTGLFGAAVTSAPASFGFGQTSTTAAPVFGQAATTTVAPVFGQTTTPATTAFGQATPTSASTGFGQPSGGAPAFGQSAFSKPQETGLGLGFGGFGLGGAPSQQANKNPFGLSDAASQPSQGASLFGGKSVSSPPSFGSQPSFGSSPSGSFGGGGGGGSFSTGAGNVASSGFSISNTGGAPQSPGQGSGFGSTASFGSTPSFGSTQAFGSAPAFGGQAAFSSFPQTAQTSGSFGSPSGGGFGQAASMPTFGSISQSGGSPGFGALAQSSSPGFGDVANQSPTGFGGFGGQPAQQPGFGGQPAQQPGFGSFGSAGGGATGGFGGGSSSTGHFNQWR